MEYRRFLAAAFTIVNMLHLASGGGIIDIHFLRYQDDCDEFAGANKCDPMFTFCVTRPGFPNSVKRSECWYKATSQSGHFHNTDDINLENKNNMEGLANPWNMTFDKLYDNSSVKLVWRVQNQDTFILGSEHMVTAHITLEEPVWPNRALAKYASRRSKKSDHILKFKIRIYCTGDTYGPECAVYCPPPSDTDRYYCDQDTGGKKCIEGWEGENCDTNIDECVQGVCVHGDCTDTPGSYTCDNCDQDYTGPNCDQPVDPCQKDPCGGRGDCTSSDDKTQYTCQCNYPYTGSQCQESSPTTTPTTTSTTTTTTTATTTTTTTTPSTTTDTTSITSTTDASQSQTSSQPRTSNIGAPGPVTSSTTSSHRTDSTNGPVAQASKASSAGFNTWIILVIGLCLLIVIGSFIICFVCRRKKIQRRKESRTPLPTVLYDGENLAFDNNTYNQDDGDHAQQETRREGLPPLPSAPALTQMNLSFQPEKEVDKCHDDMDDDGYVKARPSTSSFTRDNTDGMTASGRARANSNLYSNFDNISKDPTNQSNPDYEDEQHYHDLDEAAMSVRNNGGEASIIPPLGAEEEGAYSDIPRNTPSYKNKTSANNYDSVDIGPDSRGFPKLQPSTFKGPAPKPSSTPNPPQPSASKKKVYPDISGDPLRRSDPFASRVDVDDYDGHDFDLTTRDNGGEYVTPRSSAKARHVGDGEGGYEMPTSDGFDDGPRKRSNETGGYEVPDRSSAEYATPTTSRKPPPIPIKPPSALHPPVGHTYSNHPKQPDNHEAEREEEELSFPPPPPPLSPDDINDVENDVSSRSWSSAPAPRPLSFHHGQTDTHDDEENENDDDDSGNAKRRYLQNGGFLNPTFGGEGQSDPHQSPASPDHQHENSPDTKTTNRNSRPLSFHFGQTEVEDSNEEDEEQEAIGSNSSSSSRKKGFENDGFVNPMFNSQSPSDPTVPTGDAGNDQTPPESVPPEIAPKPGLPPLYMENLLFDDMDL